MSKTSYVRLVADEKYRLPDVGSLHGEFRDFFGTRMKVDSETWHWVFVFPAITTQKEIEDFDQMWDKAEVESMAKRIFMSRSIQEFGTEGMFAKEMTKKEFHQTARALIMQILTSCRNGFKVQKTHSIDEDEVLLMIEAQNMDAIRKIADKQELRMPINPAEYGKINQTRPEIVCPTIEFHGGTFDATADLCPMHLRYNDSHADKFMEFRDVDKIRLLRRRMRDFFSLPELENSGLVNALMPVHHYEYVEYFMRIGWSNPANIYRWSDAREINRVRDYFGEEVGFFFHWLNLYTRWLAVPAFLGLIVSLSKLQPHIEVQGAAEIFYTMFIVLWSVVFLAKYTERASLKCQEWGMKNYAQGAEVRKEFVAKIRGTLNESSRRASHWFIAFLFIVETFVALSYINEFRARAHAGEAVLGLSPSIANKVGKYFVTANITIVDMIWSAISPKLADLENWRTDQEFKDAKATKLFTVKFFLYYYPFFYYAFLQEHVEGCPGGSRSGCNEVLAENLYIFFLTHIFKVVLGAVLPILFVRFEIWKEARRFPDKTFTYLQVQNKCSKYPGDTDDFMNLVVCMGFVMMFAVALPCMATISFMCNLVELRMQAFKMIHFYRRVDPKGQEGIGAWLQIMWILSKFGVIVNVGMAVFSMRPLRAQPLPAKLLQFIIAEHFLFMSTWIIQTQIDAQGITERAIQEIDEDVLDDILGDVDARVEVEPTDALDLPLVITGDVDMS